MTDSAALRQQDLAALIGMLAVLEGAARTGDLPLDQGLRLRRRLVTAGLLRADQPYAAFAERLGELNQRLRTLEHHGYGADAGGAADLPVENVVAFPDPQAAASYADEVRGSGTDVEGPVAEQRYRRWTVVARTARGDGDPFADVAPQAARAIARGGWHLGAC